MRSKIQIKALRSRNKKGEWLNGSRARRNARCDPRHGTRDGGLKFSRQLLAAKVKRETQLQGLQGTRR